MSSATNSEATFLGHPRGLAILFFTEMWERFSYYGMRALLVLFLIANVGDGGFGWTKVEALTLYGWYTMAVYLVAIPGGIIADKLLGQKKTVMLGGFILVAGHFMMTGLLKSEDQGSGFGLFSFSGRITAFAGPLLAGTMTFFFSQRIGLLSISIFFIIGFILMLFVDKEPKS